MWNASITLLKPSLTVSAMSRSFDISPSPNLRQASRNRLDRQMICFVGLQVLDEVPGKWLRQILQREKALTAGGKFEQALAQGELVGRQFRPNRMTARQ